jgi:hypothetical protein
MRNSGGVVLEYFKWPHRGSRPYKSYGGMNVLGEDDHGTWLWSSPRPRQVSADYDSFMTLVPHQDCWTATWIFDGLTRNKIWVDITTPPEWRTPTHVTTIDLDIDVQLLSDGRVEVLDEDEFAERAIEWGYPPEIQTTAPAVAQQVAKLLRDGGEPFSATGDAWLSAARTSGARSTLD